MKKLFSILFTLVCMATCYAATVGADKGSINIYTNVSENYVPNTVEISFAVETTDKNATVASNKNKEIAQKAIESIKKYLNTEKGDVIRTDGFNVIAQYNWTNNKKNFENYKATNSFTVKLKDTAKIGDVINTAMQMGVTRVSNLNYSLEETDAYCTSLISKAAKTAKTRADIVAKSIDYKVVGLKGASTSCSTKNSSTYNRYMMTNASKSYDGTEGSVPVESGVFKINATFNGDFYIQ